MTYRLCQGLGAFNRRAKGAQFAYTVDGSTAGRIEGETFSADGVKITIRGVAVHPGFQGRGLGREIIGRLRDASASHRKIILYANPGKEGFYEKLGFLPMKTAMAIFRNRDHAISTGLVEEP